MANEDFLQIPLPAHILPDKGHSLTSVLLKGLLASLSIKLSTTTRSVQNDVEKGLEASDSPDEPES